MCTREKRFHGSNVGTPECSDSDARCIHKRTVILIAQLTAETGMTTDQVRHALWVEDGE